MLTSQENELLMEVGTGTPMGDLMRRFWHPVAATAQLQNTGVAHVRLLGESLVLYRDGHGELGLLSERCAHRGMSLDYGIPEKRGLRCAFHGWRYNAQGRCVEQPTEPAHVTQSEQVRIGAYPVRELGGLIFAYLGPEPQPLLPRYNALVWDDASGETNGCVIPCNWLQIMENLLDPVHVNWLHGRFFAYVLEQKDPAELEEFRAHHAPAPITMMAFERFESGLIERYARRSTDEPTWKGGEALFFPTTWLVGSARTRASLIFIVPLDDTHTWFLLHMARRGAPGGRREAFPFMDVPGADGQGNFYLDRAHGQDYAAAVTPGAMTPRDKEHLGASDIGLIAYRDLLQEQLRLVLDGGEPMNVRRTAAANQCIEFPASMHRETEYRVAAPC